jgi:hypothetical protein
MIIYFLPLPRFFIIGALVSIIRVRETLLITLTILLTLLAPLLILRTFIIRATVRLSLSLGSPLTAFSLISVFIKSYKLT